MSKYTLDLQRSRRSGIVAIPTSFYQRTPQQRRRNVRTSGMANPHLRSTNDPLYVPPLSAHTTLAPSPSSTNSPRPLTNTPSSLRSARLSRSQLRLLSLSAARQLSSKSKHSLASSTTSALTNKCRKKEEMRVKFARESKRIVTISICFV